MADGLVRAVHWATQTEHTWDVLTRRTDRCCLGSPGRTARPPQQPEDTMPRRRGMMITCLPLVLALATAPPLAAQGSTGTIRGTITRAGPAPDPVAGAQVFIVGGRLGSVT